MKWPWIKRSTVRQILVDRISIHISLSDRYAKGGSFHDLTLSRKHDGVAESLQSLLDEYFKD